MATTLVGSATIGNVAQASGLSNQSRIFYGINSARWFIFFQTAGDTTHVNCWVSSSNDLSSATWAAIGTGATSPASTAVVANEGRHIGIAYQSIAANDIAYLVISTSDITTAAATQAIRVSLTSTVATWSSWVNTTTTPTPSSNIPTGSTAGISTTGRAWLIQSRFTQDKDFCAAIATNADAGTSWTSGWGAATLLDNSMAQTVNSGGLAQLASGLMLGVADTGVLTATTLNQIFVKSTSATAWPANAVRSKVFAADTGAAQDKNDWAMGATSTSDIHVVRRATSTSFDHRRTTDGVTWGTLVTITSTGLTGHLAGSGLGLASDGTSMWLFVIDTDANKNIKYLKWTSGGGWDAAWSTLSTSDTNTKAFINVSDSVGNNQIGVIWTENASTPFAIVGSFLSTAAGGSIPPGLGPVVSMQEPFHLDVAMMR